jgi:hypothetical protein
MIRALRSRAMLSLLAITTTFAVTRAAEASITLQSCGALHGGGGGTGFFTATRSNPLDGYLAKVDVWYGTAGGFGDVVNGIEWTFCLSTPPGQTCVARTVGSKVGNAGSFTLDWQAGERLIFVQGGAGLYLDAIQFSTTWGRWSGWFGGHGGTGWAQGASGSQFLNEFYGTAGSIVDSIGICAVN